MKNKGAKQKLKRKGAASAFGCDLTEHLESSGQDVPYVLKSCAEFIETHGIVDGIYRLSGVTSNIQKLRQEFVSDQCPDLTREVYLQDIHCVGSLCKLYFRELPNPLLTYELYKKFTEAVSRFPEDEQLARIQNVIRELPPSHYRTLEYLIKHLTHLASFSSMTNMHTRNLALVWAPNLLRSKEIEAVGCNGDAAFLEVRVQQLVIEFILNHVDQIFSNNRKASSAESIENAPVVKNLTHPSTSLPMKLVSLEEAQARSLSASHPARKERRENSLPEIVPVTGSFFHTVVDLPDSKRKLSTKSKKWKSIFNLGRSGSESKSKLSRNGSVFVRAQKLSEKATIRPAKSMDSLCSLPVEGEDDKSRFKRTVTTGGFFVPVMKTRTGGTGSSYDLSKENEWEREGCVMAAKGNSELSGVKAPCRTSQAKCPPEQLKVFRAAEDAENEQTSPKGGRMFYTSETAAKSGFPSSLFPLEASPRHQRKALNISEPFAVSVPLRVSAVISTNSTPCRVPTRDKPSLSSLEELSSLVPESPSPSTLEGGGHMKMEQAPERKEKPPGPLLPTAASRGSLPEELVVARKSETLETAEPAAENQETLHGQSSSTSSLQQSSEHSPTAEQAPASEVHMGPLAAVKTEQEKVEMKTIFPEGSCSQQEIQKAKPEEGSCIKDVTEKDPANTLLEPLWPEIQHELKIIEPEEELLLFPAAVPKTVPVSESSSSVQTNIFSSGPEQCTTLSEQKSAGRTPQTTTQVPLFDATNTEQPDSHQNYQSDVAAQQSCASALPKLGTPLTSVAAPKNHHSVVEDSMRECVTSPLELNFHSQPEVNELPPGDEFSLSKGAHSESEKGKDSTCQLQKESDDHTKVQTRSEMPEIVTADRRDTLSSKALNGAGIQELKEGNAVSRTHDAGDQDDEDNWVDNVQSLELVEPWEDHQWVTSPLHSPTFKDIQEKTIPEFQPQDQRSEAGLSLRPRFSRSLSLDSKDTVMSLWTIPFSFIDAPEQQQPCSDILPLEMPKKSISPISLGKAKQDENNTCLPEEPLKTDELRYPISREETPAKQEPSRILPEPEGIKMDVSKENPWRSKLEQFLPYQNAPNSSLQAKITKEESSRSQDIALAEDTVTKVCSATESLQSNKDEETPRKVKTRPSSLNLDSLLPTPDFLTFESLAMPSAAGNFLYGQKEVKSSDSVPSLSTTCPAGAKGVSWRSPFSAHVDLDLDYLAVAHATTGRRNSAPVSVSAVRTSFMIKMCQARAVPVIPPKIQYTQIPQPLQAQNSAPQVEKKEAEAKQAGRQTQRVAWGHLEPPKSPVTEKKAKAEKENSDPAQKDSTCPWNNSIGSPLESSQSSHNPSLDAPVLRRKRTSEGETGGDNPQSSKMERPSGFSKPSYRSRPGRPQSLILFSPPFPIMDHPSSSADSRVLLSPIRSPTQTSSSSPICGDLSETSRTTPEGVMLRNKMTIPKNGQRLETSTSCFYQPQRRSVILDGRSGRQIE